MKRINILFIFIFSVPSATFSQQSDLLEKYRSMAVEYNHDLKAADKHSRSIQAGVCWKPSGWQNINIVWQHIRRNTFVPPCATKPICNTGIP